MIATGIATFIQAFPLWRIGSGFPIFMGASFTFVVPLTFIAMQQGYGTVAGAVIMSRVANRNVAKAGAGILILCGLFPPIAAFLSNIPEPVLGGILLVIMGQIIVSGIEMISKAGFTARNKLITALSLAVGIGFCEAAEEGIWLNFPILVQSIFSENIVSVVFVTAFLLNLLLPSSIEE